MKQINKNINTKEYLDNLYADPHWKDGYGDAYRRLDMVVNEAPFSYHSLDIGCADGYFTHKYMEKYPANKGYGVDLSGEVIKQIKEPGIFKQADIYDLPFESEYFGLVHMGEILEHLEDIPRAIAEVRRVMRQGGILLLTTPNNGGSDYEEHLWSWQPVEVVENLKGFTVVHQDTAFFNTHILFIKALKI